MRLRNSKHRFARHGQRSLRTGRGAVRIRARGRRLTEIVDCVRAVHAGRPFVSGQLASVLLRRGDRRTALQASSPGLAVLTEGERGVLTLVARGCTSREIAATDTDRSDPSACGAARCRAPRRRRRGRASASCRRGSRSCGTAPAPVRAALRRSRSSGRRRSSSRPVAGVMATAGAHPQDDRWLRPLRANACWFRCPQGFSARSPQRCAMPSSPRCRGTSA